MQSQGKPLVRLIGLVAAVALLACVPTTADAAPGARKARATLYSSQVVQYSGDAVTLTATLPGPKRVALLQRKSGGKWKNLARKRTSDNGRIVFTARPTGSPGVVSAYRVVGPRQKIGRRVWPAAASPTRQVSVISRTHESLVRPRGASYVGPAVSSNGRFIHLASADGWKSVIYDRQSGRSTTKNIEPEAWVQGPISDDGRYVLSTSEGGIVDLATGGTTPIDLGGYASSDGWWMAADASAVVYMYRALGSRSAPTARVWTQNGAVRDLVPGTTTKALDVSADGRKALAVFDPDGDDPRYAIVDTQDGTLAEVSLADGYRPYQLSPDGTQLLAGGFGGLAVMDLDGRVLRDGMPPLPAHLSVMDLFLLDGGVVLINAQWPSPNYPNYAFSWDADGTLRAIRPSSVRPSETYEFAAVSSDGGTRVVTTRSPALVPDGGGTLFRDLLILN